MQPFGLTERLVRTSVARLAPDDWLASRRSGRLSEYRLSHAGPDALPRCHAPHLRGPRRGLEPATGRWC